MSVSPAPIGGVPGLPDSADGYLSLRGLARYADLSVRTLRVHLHATRAPLPHYRVGGKILIRRSEFDRWMTQFRVGGRPVASRDEIDQLVQEVCVDLGQSLTTRRRPPTMPAHT